MKFNPMGKWTLIRPHSAEKNYGTSFVAADDNRYMPQMGDVLGVGPDVSDLKEADQVMFQANGSVEVTVDEEKLILVHIHQILGKWTSI